MDNEYDKSMQTHLLATSIVMDAFGNRTDKAGNPYTAHLFNVAKHASLNANSEDMAVAIMHDLLEDCPEWTAERLRNYFSEDIVSDVICLTRKPEDSYEAYIAKIVSSGVKRILQIKIADLEDNMDLKRMHELTDKDLDRIKRYHKTWRKLKQLNLQDF